MFFLFFFLFSLMLFLQYTCNVIQKGIYSLGPIFSSSVHLHKVHNTLLNGTVSIVHLKLYSYLNAKHFFNAER